MFRYLLPFLLIISALVLFFTFTSNLLYAPLTIDAGTQKVSGGLIALFKERSALRGALNVSFDLQNQTKDLVEEYHRLDTEDVENVEKLLPDHIDTVQLVIDVNNIATRHGMTIQDVEIQTEDSTRRTIASRQGTSPARPEKTAIIGFAASGNYNALQSFLSDLAKSLRLVDVRALSFTAGENNFYRYNFELQTYWLP